MFEVRPYRSAAGRVMWLSLLFAAYAIMGIIAAGSDWLEIQLLKGAMDGGAITESEAIANDLRQMFVGLIQLGLIVMITIFYCFWIHRANANARALGAENMVFTPGWCVGWFFIPFANLFKPFQAVREIWRASSSEPGPWQDRPVAGIVGIWWTLWIIGGVLDRAAGRAAFRAEEIEEIITSSQITLVSDIAGIPLAIVALLVVQRIHKMQEQRAFTQPDQPVLNSPGFLPPVPVGANDGPPSMSTPPSLPSPSDRVPPGMLIPPPAKKQ